MGEERRQVDLGLLFKSDLVSICSFVKPGGRAPYPTPLEQWGCVCTCVTGNCQNPEGRVET